MTKNQAARMSCFIVLAVVMLGMLSNFFRDKETTLSSFYSEPNHTVEAIFVGSSHVNSAFMPGVMAAEYGISAHNVFSWSQPMWISYHYIKEALKTQTPKVVVLDMYGMLYGNADEQPQETDRVNYLNSFTIDPGLNYLEMIATVAKCGIDLREPAEFLNLVRFHSRWKYISERNFTYDAHKQPSYLKGYGFQTNVYSGAAPVYSGADTAAVPYEYCVEYVEKIVSLSKKEGFSLVFTLAPFTFGEAQMPYFRWIEQYAAEQGIPLLNYCDTQKAAEIGLDWATDMADASHTNYLGALKITRDIAAFLQENYSFTPIENLPNGQAIAADAQKLYRVVDIYEAYCQGAAGFIEWAAANTNASVLAVGTGGAQAPAYEVQQSLQRLHMQNLSETLGVAGQNYVGVFGPDGTTEEFGAQAASMGVQLGGQAAELAADAAQTNGTYIRVGGKEFACAPGSLLLVYYDEVLARPVYVFTLGPDGTFAFEEILTK